jgi:hypothetical protein
LIKLPIDNGEDHTKKARINKAVEITIKHGEFSYLYLEFSNGERIKLVRPAIKQ